MRFFTCLAVFTFTALSFAPTAQAMDQYTIDEGHTRALFLVNHLGFSNMPGTFSKINGTFSFDAEKVENSVIDVTIDATSVDVDHDVLNEKLLGKEFFNTAEYPTITFKSTGIEKTSDDTGVVTGDLTLLGVTKPVTLSVKFNQGMFNQYAGKYTVGFTGKTVIKRSDFGMDYLVPGVSDEVKLRLEMEGNRIEPEDSNAEER